MTTSSNGSTFRVTDHLCGEFTGARWIPHTRQWRGALMFSLICAWLDSWVTNGDLRRHRAYYDVTVHWNGNVFILMKSLSLAALEVVKMTTSSAASDENFVKMTTFSFQCNGGLNQNPMWMGFEATFSLWWWVYSVSVYRQLECLLNSFFSLTTKKTSMRSITGTSWDISLKRLTKILISYTQNVDKI